MTIVIGDIVFFCGCGHESIDHKMGSGGGGCNHCGCENTSMQAYTEASKAVRMARSLGMIPACSKGAKP